ncbi:MAG: hypothetical protein QJR02_10315 [Sinobacteraceae bacterium]|nr:hypothetical protein [Nevskiaceae bacterium]
MSKAWYKSRTLWLNAVALVLAAAADNWSALQSVLPAHWYAWLAFALPVANAILRTITTQPLHWSAPRDTGAGGKC